jgi:hypothetical protein
MLDISAKRSCVVLPFSIVDGSCIGSAASHMIDDILFLRKYDRRFVS